MYFICITAGYDIGTVDPTLTSKSSSHQCKYGDISLSLGQKLIISQQSDSDTYNTSCTCDKPPLVTCIKSRKQNVWKMNEILIL